MVKFNILKIYEKDIPYKIFIFDKFDDVVRKIIYDNKLYTSKLQKSSIRNKLANTLLNKGRCTFRINNLTYEIEAEINSENTLLEIMQREKIK